MKFPDYIAQLYIQHKINFIKGDLEYLHKMLINISFNLREDVIHQYIDVWSTAMAECTQPLKAMNAGRRAANTYLREFIDERNSKVL